MRKKTVTCDIGIAQYEDGIIKCEKKSKGTTKCEKKKLLYVMLELHNVRMEPSNMKKKSKKTTKCKKRIVTWDVETIQCDNEIVNCEKKLREPSIVTKVLSYVTLKQHNIRMEPSNVRKK